MSLERDALDRSPGDLGVFISNRESRCDECGEHLGRRAMIVLAGNRGALCLTCAISTTFLSYLPATRRSRGGPDGTPRSPPSC
jgi:hypothetical protein